MCALCQQITLNNNHAVQEDISVNNYLLLIETIDFHGARDLIGVIAYGTDQVRMRVKVRVWVDVEVKVEVEVRVRVRV